MRMLPFFKPKKGFMIAGGGLEASSGGGGGGGGGALDYSTDEQDTDIKWIDGKSIFCKTFSNVSITAGGVILDNTVSYDTLVKVEGQSSFRYSAQEIYNYNFGYSNYTKPWVYILNGVLYGRADTSDCTATITIYYTKSN